MGAAAGGAIMKITQAQRKVLALCADGLTPIGKTIYGVRGPTLGVLEGFGLIRFRSRAHEPHWMLTAAGREALRRAEIACDIRATETAEGWQATHSGRQVYSVARTRAQAIERCIEATAKIIRLEERAKKEAAKA